MKKNIDRDSAERVVTHLSMTKLFGSRFMFGTDCPLCGNKKCLVIWADKGTIRCYKCGLVGEFQRAHERGEENGLENERPIVAD